jgi:hypothetical protein
MYGKLAVEVEQADVMVAHCILKESLLDPEPSIFIYYLVLHFSTQISAIV